MDPMRTITPEQMSLLANIFRVIVKEIRYDEDKEKLAPGELGVSYLEGCIYVRNPHTGELFCPNSIAHINQITEKFDSQTGLLNADRVSGIRFYSNISQLTPLGITLTMDSIIRQMEYPSILMSPVEYDNYSIMGFPSNNGMILVYKIDPEFVTCSYYDCNTYVTYDGRYNRFKHLFEGWAISGSEDSEYLETIGGGSTTQLNGTEELTDLMLLTVRVTETLTPGATISYNGGRYLPILNTDGTALGNTIAANNIIMLIYDEAKSGWMWLNSTQSTTKALLDVTNERLSDTMKRVDTIVKDYQERLTLMQQYVDTQLAAHAAMPGKLITCVSTFKAPTAATSTVNAIENFDAAVDKLLVNYNQTILRPGIDYIVEDTNGIQLLNFVMNKDEILQFIVFKQAATAQQTQSKD